MDEYPTAEERLIQASFRIGDVVEVRLVERPEAG